MNERKFGLVICEQWEHVLDGELIESEKGAGYADSGSG